MPARVVVIYYSATGNVRTMAEHLSAGASEAGAEVRTRRVAELAPSETVAENPRWQAHLQSDTTELATLDDLSWADGIALGSPTRFGGPAAQLKQFLDTTGRLWMADAFRDKVGTSFTSASTDHGGLEATVLAINNHFYHWGAIVLPMGYHVPELRREGNPYGPSFVSHRSAPPDDAALLACRAHGAALARLAGFVAAGVAAER